MKHYQEVQKGFEWLGFDLKLSDHNILGTMVISLSGIISEWIFLLFEANSSQEYLESIYFITSSVGIFISYTSALLLKDKLLVFIDTVDRTINKSKFDNQLNFQINFSIFKMNLGLESSIAKAMYEEANQRFEKYTKIGMFLLTNVLVPCALLPKVIVSFFLYFNTDLGENAFYLPLPLW